MADNFIPLSNNSWAQVLGQGLGQGLASEHYSTRDLLAQMAQQKAQDMRARSLKQFMPGATQEQLAALSGLPQEIQVAALMGGFGQNQPQQQTMPQQLPQGLMQSQQQTTPLSQLQEALQQQKPEKIPSYAEQEFLRRMQKQYGKQLPQEMQPQVISSTQKVPTVPQPMTQITSVPSKQLSESPVTLGEAIRAASPQAAKEKREQAKEALIREKEINKTTQKYVDKIKSEHDYAEFSTPRLNKMKRLIEKGGLPVSSFYKTIKNIEDHLTPEKGAAVGAALGGLAGAPTLGLFSPAGAAVGGAIGSAASLLGPILSQIQRTTSPNTEEFEKLSATFLRGAKDTFGGRFTNEEMKAYLAMIPTLANTDKGKLDIINDFELFNKAANIKYKAMNQIIKENGGKRPYDLAERVEQRVQPQLDKLSDAFKQDLNSYFSAGT